MRYDGRNGKRLGTRPASGRGLRPKGTGYPASCVHYRPTRSPIRDFLREAAHDEAVQGIAGFLLLMALTQVLFLALGAYLGYGEAPGWIPFL